MMYILDCRQNGDIFHLRLQRSSIGRRGFISLTLDSPRLQIPRRRWFLASSLGGGVADGEAILRFATFGFWLHLQAVLEYEEKNISPSCACLCLCQSASRQPCLPNPGGARDCLVSIASNERSTFKSAVFIRKIPISFPSPPPPGAIKGKRGGKGEEINPADAKSQSSGRCWAPVVLGRVLESALNSGLPRLRIWRGLRVLGVATLGRGDLSSGSFLPAPRGPEKTRPSPVAAGTSLPGCRVPCSALTRRWCRRRPAVPSFGGGA